MLKKFAHDLDIKYIKVYGNSFYILWHLSYMHGLLKCVERVDVLPVKVALILFELDKKVFFVTSAESFLRCFDLSDPDVKFAF